MSFLATEIFREYDIRGIYNTNLFDNTAYLIGKTLPKITKSFNICIARDGRVSSPNFTQNLINGLLDGGMSIYNLGLTATPTLYYATHKLNVQNGIIVTGSHNPKDHNGFKFIINGKSFFGKDLQKLFTLIQLEKHETFKSLKNNLGSVIEFSVDKCYLQYLLSKFQINHKIKIVWDSGNGATGQLIKELLYYLPGEHILINEKIDGHFPNHHPDPSVENNLQELRDIVLTNKYDLGIAFDGDGDRIGLIDDQGRMIQGDIITLILAKFSLSDVQNAKIIADVKSSKILFEELNKLGIQTLMYKTGHSLIKHKMAETDADLAGEVSGHIFFKDNYYFDDAIYAALKICQLLSNISLPFSEIVNSLPQTFCTNEIKVICEEKLKFTVINKIKTFFEKNNVSFINIDGIRFETSNSWWLLRASNTQAALTIRCEGNSLEHLHTIKQHLKETLLKIGITFEELNGF